MYFSSLDRWTFQAAAAAAVPRVFAAHAQRANMAADVPAPKLTRLHANDASTYTIHHNYMYINICIL